MANIDIERRAGLSSSVAVKGPCRVATTANITLSGLQTIDTVALAEFDRVLVKNQTDAKLNGIYEVSTGEWQRTPDFRSNRDVKHGTLVHVHSGAVGGGDYRVSSADPIEFDSDNITFETFTSGDATAAAASAAAAALSATAAAASAVAAAASAASVTPLPNQVVAAAAKSAPVDADLMATVETAGPTLKKTTWLQAWTGYFKAKVEALLAVMFGKGADVASAGTVTLGDGDLFHITGGITITDIDFANGWDGREATLIFDGSLILTHNGTTLKLPGEANIPVVAGDRCTIVQDSADNIIVTSYTPKLAAPYQAGSWTPTILVNGSSTGVTYSAQVGSYIKFGALVWVLLRVTLTNNGSGTGNVAIGGLPFTSKTVSGSSGILSSPFYANLSGINTTLMGSVGIASTTIDLRSSVSTTIGNMTDTNITNTADIVLVGWYEAAA